MKRISWKRGMRLTDNILRFSDEAVAEIFRSVFTLAAAGRFGLMPSTRPFKLELNIHHDSVDIVSLSCLAITKGGDLIDVNYDTINQQLRIPEAAGADEFILTINANKDTWHPSDDELYEEPTYSFSLLAPDTQVPVYAVPIGHIVNEYGWRLDEEDFVPPCLFISAHRKYEDLLQRFSDILSSIDSKILNSDISGCSDAVRIYWPLVQQLRIAASKETELMTPMSLLSNVQKCVSAFTCACALDSSIELEDAKMFRSYIYAPYNYKDAYLRIQLGINLCVSIYEKIDKLTERRQQVIEEPTAPRISKEYLNIECQDSRTKIPVSYNIYGANIFYTIDGSEPTGQSQKAMESSPNSYAIEFENGFGQKKGKEADRTLVIKLKAMVNGMSSSTNTFKILLHKSLKFRSFEFIV